ncbi:hypothetical protein AVEN_82003-1 [Araneus ventricosus]|uniref:HTH CENPB-type domain-containing protein n=1 Tax=Araneus ventricosus TaxID=182803 RepID=A0A4Y2MLH8_ARAVE|nr:hypothetical protein AVEN_82003-1 [Araneus ventricosus]
MDEKRTDLSVKEKIEILNRYESLLKMSERDAAAQLKISQPLLCKILKNREDLLRRAKENNTNCKRNICSKDEKAPKLWFTNIQERGSPISGPLMRQKAEDLAAKMGQKAFVASDGWFHRWRKRENVVFKQTHGEQKSADVAAADQWIEKEWAKPHCIISPKRCVQCRQKWTVL